MVFLNAIRRLQRFSGVVEGCGNLSCRGPVVWEDGFGCLPLLLPERVP